MGMAQNEGAPRTAEVDVPLTIGVPNVGTLTLVNEERRAPYGTKRSNRGIHTSRKPKARFFEECGTGCSAMCGRV